MEEAKEAPREQAYSLTYGRPDVATIIQHHALDGNGRLGMIICGPQGMLIEARKSVATILGSKTRDVDVSIASFGW